MSNGAYLVCFRTSDIQYYQIVPGSIKAFCASCGSQVYVSPVSWKIKEEQEALILCMQCSVASVRESHYAGEKTELVIMQKQLEEAAKTKEGIQKSIREN